MDWKSTIVPVSITNAKESPTGKKKNVRLPNVPTSAEQQMPFLDTRKSFPSQQKALFVAGL